MATPANYPSLEQIANLTRSLVNDDGPGATGTPGEGQILTDTSVTLQNLMDSAIREVYREVRGSSMQQTLIRDNVLFLDLPPVNSSLGVGAINPAVQVALQWGGWFDGLNLNSDWTLPSDLILPLEVWFRQTGSGNLPFAQLSESTGPLRSAYQSVSPGQWEWRGDSIWMNGSTVPMDLRLRYISTFAPLALADVDWATTYVPILDSQEAVADKIVLRYSRRLASTESQALIPDLIAQADRSMLRLRQQTARARQKINFGVRLYGGTARARSNFLF